MRGPDEHLPQRQHDALADCHRLLGSHPGLFARRDRRPIVRDTVILRDFTGRRGLPGRAQAGQRRASSCSPSQWRGARVATLAAIAAERCRRSSADMRRPECSASAVAVTS
jgi:hypothetical protein